MDGALTFRAGGEGFVFDGLAAFKGETTVFAFVDV